MKAKRITVPVLPRKHVLVRLDPGKVSLNPKRQDTTTITTSGTTCGLASAD